MVVLWPGPKNRATCNAQQDDASIKTPSPSAKLSPLLQLYLSQHRHVPSSATFSCHPRPIVPLSVPPARHPFLLPALRSVLPRRYVPHLAAAVSLHCPLSISSIHPLSVLSHHSSVNKHHTPPCHQNKRQIHHNNIHVPSDTQHLCQ